MSTTGKTILVPVTNSNFLEIVKLDQAFDPPWSLKEWQELDPTHHTYLGWKLDGKIQGYALLVTLPQETTAHLLKIYLEPVLRGSGDATYFWKDICEKLKEKSYNEVYLEVKAQNIPAVKFYQKLGFKTLRLIKGYYSEGSDGLMMNLTI